MTRMTKFLLAVVLLFASRTSAQTAFPGALDVTGTFGVAVHGQPVKKETINNMRDAVIALETKLGQDSSLVVGSIDYLLKNTASVDPGHKHSGASITALDASKITTGTFADARLSANIARLDGVNAWSGIQTFNAGIVVNGVVAATTLAGDGAAVTNLGENHITNGSILARVADNESITGSWSFIANISKIRNVSYVWPLANGGGVLFNDGGGTLSWTATPSFTAIVTPQISADPGSGISIFTTGSGDNDIFLSVTEHGHVFVGTDGPSVKVGGVLFAATSNVTISNTTSSGIWVTSTSLIPGVGRIVHVTTNGLLAVGTGGADTFRYTIRFAGVDICDSGNLNPVPTTNMNYHVEADIIITTAGSSGAFNCSGTFEVDGDVGTPGDRVIFNSGATLIDLDGTPAIQVTDRINFSTADPSNTLTESVFVLKLE